MPAPVVFIVFNRPDQTRRVFERIRDARPSQLLVVSDGPRPEVPTDTAKVAEVRRIIEEGTDWPCKVECDYATTNLGCSRRPASGITWALSQVEEAIILEDDCLPDASFFPYCTALLKHHRDDPRVMHIGANNFLRGKASFSGSYAFTRYNHNWGWATWRRAWSHFDLELKDWSDPELRRRSLAGCTTADERGFWHSVFNACAATPEKVNTWDFQWTFACWAAGALATYPSVNLVENIGFGTDATHTFQTTSKQHCPSTPLTHPIVHPKAVRANARFDRQAFYSVFMSPTPLTERVARAVRRLTAKQERPQIP